MIKNIMILFWIVPIQIIALGCVHGDQMVETVGVSLYSESDPSSTRANALLDAQRRALEETVGIYIQAKTRIEKSLLIEEQILAHSEGYIKSYEILREWREGDFYKIRIKAIVATEELRSKLVALGLYRKQKERLIVSIMSRKRDFLLKNKSRILYLNMLTPAEDTAIEDDTNLWQLGGALRYYPLGRLFFEADFLTAMSDTNARNVTRTMSAPTIYGGVSYSTSFTLMSFEYVAGLQLLNTRRLQLGVKGGIANNRIETKSYNIRKNTNLDSPDPLSDIRSGSLRQNNLILSVEFEYCITDRFSVAAEAFHDKLGLVTIEDLSLKFKPHWLQTRILFYF